MPNKRQKKKALKWKSYQKGNMSCRDKRDFSVSGTEKISQPDLGQVADKDGMNRLSSENKQHL